MNFLLKHLLEFFLFAGTVFAAADVSIASGGDGGGNGEPSSGAHENDAGISSGDQTSNEAGVGLDGKEISSSQSDRAEAGDAEILEGASDELVDFGDGQKVPRKYLDLFKQDKDLKRAYMGSLAFHRLFPGGVKAAGQLLKDLESFGGVENIRSLKQDNDLFHQDAEQFVNQPAEWIKNAFEGNAEASLAAFSHALDYMGDHHAEQYDHLMARVVKNTQEAYGFSKRDLGRMPVHDAWRVLSALKDNPEAQRVASLLADWYNGSLVKMVDDVENLSSKVPEKKLDPEREKLAAETTKLSSEREKLNNDRINQQTIPRLGRQMTERLERFAKAANFDLKNFAAERPGALKALRTEILNRIVEKAASDQGFKSNYRKLVAAGEVARAVEMANRKHDEIFGEIVEAVAREYGIGRRSTKAGNGNRGSNGQFQAGNQNPGMTRVKEKPAANLIDWGKTGTKIYDSIAVMKDGKTVTWAS